MSTVLTALGSEWRRVAGVLGIEVVAPFALSLPSGTQVDAAALVKGFGAPNGMLLLTDYSKVRQELRALAELGFGFSVLEEPGDGDEFILDEYVDLLRDWGWAGPSESEPIWLREAATGEG
jgi:hypothetical protein